MKPTGISLGEQLGLASHMSTGAEYDRDRIFEIERAQEAGIRVVRRGFYWPSIQPLEDTWVFDGYDVVVELLSSHNLSPCALLTRAAPWAAPGGSPSEIPPAAFGAFAGAVARRYGPAIDLYEIWNEPNSGLFWDGGPDPGHYGSLLKAASIAIHNDDPTAAVLFGGLSGLDPHFFDPRGIWNFIARVAEAHPDLCDVVDGIAIHPYSFLQHFSPESSFTLGPYHYPDLRGSINEVREILNEIGCPDKPIHLTEIGWPSLLLGLERQAAYLTRSVLLAAAGGASSYFWYTFFDEEPSSTIPTEDYFGLYEKPNGETDPRPKPSYHALVGLHTLLGAAHYAGDLGQALGWDQHTYGLVFADSQSWIIALWQAGSSFHDEITISLPLPQGGAGYWSLFDQDGALLVSGTSDTGWIDLTVSGRVNYLRSPRTVAPR